MKAVLVTLSLVLVGPGCVSARHAEVQLAGNPAGADCFATCTAQHDGDAALACVAACPVAQQDSGACDSDAPACVETKRISFWKTAGLVLLGAVVFVALGGGG